jgi:hypothetical protein
MGPLSQFVPLRVSALLIRRYPRVADQAGGCSWRSCCGWQVANVQIQELSGNLPLQRWPDFESRAALVPDAVKGQESLSRCLGPRPTRIAFKGIFIAFEGTFYRDEGTNPGLRPPPAPNYRL